MSFYILMCNYYNYYVGLITLNTRFCSLRIIDLWVHPIPNNKRMFFFVWIACTELKNEFANSENVLYKRCFVMLKKIEKS